MISAFTVIEKNIISRLFTYNSLDIDIDLAIKLVKVKPESPFVQTCENLKTFLSETTRPNALI